MGEQESERCADCIPKDVIREVRDDVKQILLVISGPLGKPEEGVCGRVGSLESWRKASTTRVNSAKGFIGGIIGSVLATLIVGTIMAYTVNRIEQRLSIRNELIKAEEVQAIARVAAEKVVAEAKLTENNK